MQGKTARRPTTSGLFTPSGGLFTPGGALVADAHSSRAEKTTQDLFKPLDGRNRAIVIAELLKRIIAAIR